MLKCIIIDQHQQSLQHYKSFIKKVAFLEFTGHFTDPKKALLFLKTHHADLTFMNIKQPVDGASPLLPIFQQNTLVILLAANGRFAKDGYDFGAIDYLLKSDSYERFYRAAEKAYRIKNPTEQTRQVPQPASRKGGYIFIKESTQLIRIDLDDIYYVTGLKNYVSIMTKSHRIVSLQTMKQMETLLPAHRFARVHRSYFVAIDKIISVEKQQIHIKDKIIPIGNIHYAPFMKKLGKMMS
jgi:DNA-binding LytR/AlgR family response regulator